MQKSVIGSICTYLMSCDAGFESVQGLAPMNVSVEYEINLFFDLSHKQCLLNERS